jgi:hypothetical protein
MNMFLVMVDVSHQQTSLPVEKIGLPVEAGFKTSLPISHPLVFPQSFSNLSNVFSNMPSHVLQSWILIFQSNST